MTRGKGRAELEAAHRFVLAEADRVIDEMQRALARVEELAKESGPDGR